MKVAIYPGSFNPWHKGHQDVLDKALKVFDIVYVARGVNSSKEKYDLDLLSIENGKVISVQYCGLLKDYLDNNSITPDAIIKGLRNAQDLEYETTQQYWNEDLGIDITTFYVITDRNLRHISSSAIRAIDKIKKV